LAISTSASGLRHAYACLVILSSLAYSTLAAAFEPPGAQVRYLHRSWTKEQGLPDSQVHAIRQTRDGYLWVGTSRGLARFDGLRFVVFDHVNTPAMRDENCLLLAEDMPWNIFLTVSRGGTVWLPAAERGLLSWRDGNWANISLEDGSTPGVNLALCAAEDEEGNLWVGTQKGGLVRCWLGKVETLDAKAGLPLDNTWALCEDTDGSVWVGTDGGVGHFIEGRCTNLTKSQGLSHDSIRALAVDPSGTLWVGTGNGLHTLRNGQVQSFQLGGQWFESKIRVILPTRDGAVWVGTAVGLHRFRAGRDDRFTVTNGLPSEDIRALLLDRSGDLWIGSLGGLSRLRNARASGDGGFETFTTAHGLSNNSVWALHEDGEGVLWIGTEQGLCRLDSGQFTTFTRKSGLPDDLVNFILEDGGTW
jgi:ligand-binding sensor domain-containing protein